MPSYSEMVLVILCYTYVTIPFVPGITWQSGVDLPSVPGMSLVVPNFRVCYDAPCNDAPEVALSYVDCSALCWLQQVGVIGKPHEEASNATQLWSVVLVSYVRIATD